MLVSKCKYCNREIFNCFDSSWYRKAIKVSARTMNKKQAPELCLEFYPLALFIWYLELWWKLFLDYCAQGQILCPREFCLSDQSLRPLWVQFRKQCDLYRENVYKLENSNWENRTNVFAGIEIGKACRIILPSSSPCWA